MEKDEKLDVALDFINCIKSSKEYIFVNYDLIRAMAYVDIEDWDRADRALNAEWLIEKVDKRIISDFKDALMHKNKEDFYKTAYNIISNNQIGFVTKLTRCYVSAVDDLM